MQKEQALTEATFNQINNGMQVFKRKRKYVINDEKIAQFQEQYVKGLITDEEYVDRVAHCISDY